MEKILIVEDDESIHYVIKELLHKQGFLTRSAYSGTEALLLLERESFDLILLDLMLPAVNGEEVIGKIRDTPIIVLSAKLSSEDKVNCLLSGANDYLTKPFDGKELLARIEVQLRQRNKTHVMKALNYQDLELLSDGHTLLLHQQKINLTKTEYAIFKQLLLNQPHVVPKNRLLDLISREIDACDESSLKVHISNIRKKLKKVSSKNYIESVWGIGFKLSDE